MNNQEFIQKIKTVVEMDVEKNLDKLNEREKQMLPIVTIFFQNELIEKTQTLVWATWLLAFATIAVAIVTLTLK